MNYIRHLHAFYQSIKKDDNLTAMHVTLYLALFQYWNYNRFQNPFPVNRGDIMELSKIKTKNSYHKCLKELHQKRFIVYHPSSSKFIRAEVSMIKLGLKMPEQNFNQLNLFDALNNSGHGIKNDTLYGTDIDTGKSPIENPSISKTIPVQYQNKDRDGIKNDTPMVSKSILLIKHKHKTVNCSSVCNQKSVSEIFEKNKKIQEAISSFKNSPVFSPPLEGPGEADSAQCLASPPSPLSPSPASNPINIKETHSEKTHPELKEVEKFFLEKNFSIEEAKKFFYYNQSRNWMMNSNTPIRDWQAMANKWMLNQKEKNISNSKQTNHGNNESRQSANASFLEDAKNDFFASSERSGNNHP